MTPARCCRFRDQGLQAASPTWDNRCARLLERCVPLRCGTALARRLTVTRRALSFRRASVGWRSTIASRFGRRSTTGPSAGCSLGCGHTPCNNRKAGAVKLTRAASPRAARANQSCDSGSGRGSVFRRPKQLQAGHASIGSRPAHRTAVRRRARRQHTRCMHTRLLRVIHARHLGAVLQVADKRKRVHVALAIVHLSHAHASDRPLASPMSASGAIRQRGATRVCGSARLCVVHKLAALEDAPVASPQHAAGFHFRLRHVDVEAAARRSA